MRNPATLSVVIPVLALALRAGADINGFGDLSGFKVNQGDNGSAWSYSEGTGTLHLTTSAFNEARSVFALAPQQITAFSASFTYRAPNIAYYFNNVFGACFVIQNSPSGANALGGLGNGLGYVGITKSVAASLELASNGSWSGAYTDGNVGGGAASTAPVGLGSGNPIRVTLTYNGSLLRVSLLDTVTQASYGPVSYGLDIPAKVGGNTAYVGITATTSVNGGFADQYFSDFQFTAIPAPSGLAILAAGGVLAGARRRR